MMCSVMIICHGRPKQSSLRYTCMFCWFISPFWWWQNLKRADLLEVCTKKAVYKKWAKERQKSSFLTVKRKKREMVEALSCYAMPLETVGWYKKIRERGNLKANSS